MTNPIGKAKTIALNHTLTKNTDWKAWSRTCRDCWHWVNGKCTSGVNKPGEPAYGAYCSDFRNSNPRNPKGKKNAKGPIGVLKMQANLIS